MKKIPLFHPRVFDDQEWAEGYYRRNRKSIAQVGKRFVKILKSCDFTKGKVLDVGCGFATIPIEIAKEFAGTKITGVDLSEPLLEIGRNHAKRHGLENQIDLLNGDVQKLQFEASSFDVVINSFLLHIVGDPIQMLNEIERVAKPDGCIVMTDLRRGFLAYFVKKFRTAYTLEEAAELIEKSQIRKGKLSSGFFWWDYLYNQRHN